MPNAPGIPKIEYGSPTTTITFEYPPKGPDSEGERLRQVGRVTESKSGQQQVITDYITETNRLKFSFLTETLKDEVKTFLTTHAMLGKTFTYFKDKDIPASAITVSLDRRSYTPRIRRLFASGDDYKYEIELTIRRVIV